MDEKKVLLSVKDLNVKFRVRGRILTAIRGISLDIYENESIAIVGESGSGKSVFTKTFAGMLDQNGFISEGEIMFNDDELAETYVSVGTYGARTLARIENKINGYSKLENGADTWKKILNLKSERKAKETLSDEEDEKFAARIKELQFKKTEEYNKKLTYDTRKEKDLIKKSEEEIDKYAAEIKKVEAEKAETIKAHKAALENDTEYKTKFDTEMAKLLAQYNKEIEEEISDDKKTRNKLLAKEIYLSVGRYKYRTRIKAIREMLGTCHDAMKLGADLDTEEGRLSVFSNGMYVSYIDEKDGKLHGFCHLNLAKMSYPGDWSQVRGKRIATVFQDPMTSLNPIITIGKQITSIILKHQDCSESEARARALKLMHQVGIPNAEKRFDDYPFQYSGGMRQRIVIAIALSCQPKILICDEPTTALDVTIQAQILKLLKDLQKEYNYTIVFITHDLGVVANIADRVAVLYAGQLIELGNVDEVFYDPRHPYTWALLSSLPQLAEKGDKLYSITGTPPSLYNKITGDAFAPRNPYCMKIDTLAEPPMFKVTDTHYAKTWLLDPRSPKTEKPDIIKDIHGKLLRTYHLA